MKRGLKSQLLDLFAGASSSEPRSEQAPLVAPKPPLAKRLNRNALTVAATIMGMTVIACLVVLRGGSGSTPPGTARDPVLTEAASPSFLDHPPRASLSPGALPGPGHEAAAESHDGLSGAPS